MRAISSYQPEEVEGVSNRVEHGFAERSYAAVSSRQRDRMKTYIAFFRGINVGGKNMLPMKDLVAILEGLGLQDVTTYIQSGNAVFRSKKVSVSVLSRNVSAAVKKSRGFEPGVQLLEVDELARAVASNPFPEAEPDPKTLHLGFLAEAPKKPNLKALESLRAQRESFVLKNNVFYLYAPDGIGRSKLAAKAESLIGVSMTARNWRTVSKTLAMAADA